MLATKPRRQTEPFFEGPDSPTLVRRALAECVATIALTMVVVFSAQAAWLGELRPLALGFGVPAAVAALTLAFGPATGAHFNPLVTASQWMRGHRSTRCLVAYLCAHIAGALGGAALAGPLIGQAPDAASAPISLVIGSEVFASAGLIVIVLAASLVMGPKVGLLAVVGWLVTVNLVAPAGPFANPVLAVAIPLALGSLDGPLAAFRVSAELAGFGLALLVIAITYPRRTFTSLPSKR
ncbi:aquaporin [Mycobacterium sp. KBS0706]|uniref:aquaporin n=1 Tax=Mycobacterium sp. KBS0706 TaxID=2578109 RepID=UPI00163DBE30|nr:aquaporin [Mycobacterium sp. KBS0706]